MAGHHMSGKRDWRVSRALQSYGARLQHAYSNCVEHGPLGLTFANAAEPVGRPPARTPGRTAIPCTCHNRQGLLAQLVTGHAGCTPTSRPAAKHPNVLPTGKYIQRNPAPVRGC